MGADKTHNRWLKSRPTPGGYSPEKIDAENGIIHDVVMVQEGEAKGHGVHLDADFIREIVAYDREHFSATGIKARFGHPSASNDTMGTQMGVFKNVRERKQDGKMQAIADLHLLEAADESPTHPGMRSWMLKMAAERPDFVMMSIVFSASGYYQKKKNGHKRYISSEYDADPELGEVWVEFGEKGAHFYTDAVEAGAATESLFSNQVNPHLFVAQADQFLDDHPHILQFIKDNPEKVTAFFASLGISIHQPPTKKMAEFKLFDWLLGKQPEVEGPEGLRTELEQAQFAVKQLAEEKQAAENRVKELESGNDALQSAVAQLETKLSQAAARIEELEKQPAVPPVGAPGEPEGGALSVTNPKTKEVYARYGIQ